MPVAVRWRGPLVDLAVQDLLDHRQVGPPVADVSHDPAPEQVHPVVGTILTQHGHDGAGVAGIVVHWIELVHFSRALVQDERRHVVEEGGHQILR